MGKVAGMAYWKLSVCAAVTWSVGISGSLAQQLNSQQIQIIKDTAASICNTVKEAKGQKSDVQIEGDVKAELGGLAGKFANIGGSGKGKMAREEFEGLSREATAAALQGDRDCRERLFNKMFEKLAAAPDGPVIHSTEGPIIAAHQCCDGFGRPMCPSTSPIGSSCSCDASGSGRVSGSGHVCQ